MLNKKYILILGIVVLSILIVSGARLDYANQNRECYKNNLPFFVCVVEGTNIMEASFLTYEPMHKYYTPQLKEISLSGGATETMTAKVQSKIISTDIGTLTITGSPSYLYVKGKV